MPTSPLTPHELPCVALTQALKLLADLIAAISDRDYATPPALAGTSSCIGSHVRHSLDHATALLDAIDADTCVAYHSRERGTTIETNRADAIAAIADIIQRTSAIDPAILTRPVAIEDIACPNHAPVTLQSTIAREFAFVLNHTVHHNALIGIVAAYLGYDLPDDFVFAPSTLAWMKKESCAPSP